MDAWKIDKMKREIATPSAEAEKAKADESLRRFGEAKKIAERADLSFSEKMALIDKLGI